MTQGANGAGCPSSHPDLCSLSLAFLTCQVMPGRFREEPVKEYV